MLLISFWVVTQASPAACTDPSIVWTIKAGYTDPQTGLNMTPMITGDGVQTDSSGNSVYSSSSGAMQVIARLNVCGRAPSYDATLTISKGRSFTVNLGTPLSNPYQKYPPSSLIRTAGVLNISDIMWCQNNGSPNGCTFYTRMRSQLTGPDGNIYHLNMENPVSVPVSWSMDATANCSFTTSKVQVVFTPGSLDASGKDTYVVTPVLQGTNTGSGWTAPQPNAGCPATALPSASWPAAVGVLTQGTTGNSYNFGQYGAAFQFVIRAQ
jgi:hypothetical protein